MPRARRPEPDQQRAADRARGRLPERRHLRHRHLRRDLVQAPEEAAEDERDDGERVEVGLALGHVPADGKGAPSAAQRVRPGAERAAAPASSAAGMGERRDRDVPAGGMAQRSAAHGALARHLERKRRRARRSRSRRRAPRGAARSGGPRPPRRRRAARPTGRRSGSGRAGPAGASWVSGQATQPGDDAARGTRGDEAERADQQRRRRGWRPGAARCSARSAALQARQGSRKASCGCQSSALDCAGRAPATAPSAEQRCRGEPAPPGVAGAARPQPKTARQSASTASRCAAIVSGSTWVGCSSRRARCWARRSSR